jgi:hypothetical protein
MSKPSERAAALSSSSPASDTRSGKSVSVAITLVLSTVISLRDDQAASYHPAP